MSPFKISNKITQLKKRASWLIHKPDNNCPETDILRFCQEKFSFSIYEYIPIEFLKDNMSVSRTNLAGWTIFILKIHPFTNKFAAMLNIKSMPFS